MVTGSQGNHSNDRTLVTPVIKATEPMVAVTKAVTVNEGLHAKCYTFVRLETDEEYVARFKEKSLVSIFSQIRPEGI